MRDPLHVYEVLHRLVTDMRAAQAGAWKVGLLAVVAMAVVWRVVFWWTAGSISAAEAFVLCFGLLAAEAAAVSWLGDFEGLRLALLLGLPLALWLGVETMGRVFSAESRRGFLRADMRRYRTALRRDSSNVAAHVLLGDAHMRLGQTHRGLIEYRAALALEPGSYEVRYKVARAQRQLQGG
jgi:hypothetical protein